MSLRWMGSLDMYRKVSFLFSACSNNTWTAQSLINITADMLKGTHGPHGRDETRKLPEFDIFGSHVYTLPLGNEGIFSIRVSGVYYTNDDAILSALLSIAHTPVFLCFLFFFQNGFRFGVGFQQGIESKSEF